MANWYDYKKQQAFRLPPAGLKCEVAMFDGYHKTTTIGMDGNHMVFKVFNEYRCSDIYLTFRPLDWDREL